MRSALSSLLGWESSTFEEYSACFNRFGGNFPTHPKTLSFLHARGKCKEQYWVKHNATGEPIGAFCSWDKKYLAGDAKAAETLNLNNYLLSRDELILPLSQEIRVALPFRSKWLSELHQKNIRNASFEHNSGRVICLAKSLQGEEGFSTKARKNRAREVKRFLDAGGTIEKQSAFSAEQLADIFTDLFKIRWNKIPAERDVLIDIFRHFSDMLFGHVLFFKGQPCAYQFILQTDSPDWICFDFVNGGVDTSLSELSPGTVLTWLNVQEANQIAIEQQKQMRYSFGKDTAGYKDIWCIKRKIGRMISV